MDNKAVVDEVCKRVTALVVALDIAVVGAVLVIEAFTLAVWIDVCYSIRRIKGIIEVIDVCWIIPELIIFGS